MVEALYSVTRLDYRFTQLEVLFPGITEFSQQVITSILATLVSQESVV